MLKAKHFDREKGGESSVRLKGHRAVITGAAGGIGGATAERFAREGAHIASLDLQEPATGDVRLTCDLGDDDDFSEAASQVIDRLGIPTIVIHAAAISITSAMIETSTRDLLSIHDVNVGGALRLLRAFAPPMRAARRGAFLFVSSINAGFGTPGLGAYAASKASLDAVMRTAALELAPDGIRVNTIRPASIDTSLLRAGFERTDDPAEARRRNIARHPLGRLGTANDVASLLLFLASDEASWITGVDYLIDGGASIARR